MKMSRHLTLALAAALLAGSGATLAQSYDSDRPGFDRRDHDERRYHDDRRGPSRTEYRGSPRHDGYRETPRYVYRDVPPPRYVYRDDGYPGPRFYAGGRLPRDYRSHYYVVDRWRDYPRLSPPPRGYHWVQSGTDFALVAIATGVIASVILNSQ
ncbi:MAG: RcnB family protein [Comamonas sp.]